MLHDDTQSDKVKAFLKDLVAVEARHGLSLSHEDEHGSFEVETFDKCNIEWLLDARDNTIDKS